MKQCPFCAEDVKDAAIVCKHCGRPLVDDADIPEPVLSSDKKAKEKKGFFKTNIKLGKIVIPLWLLLIFGCICSTTPVLLSDIDSEESPTDVVQGEAVVIEEDIDNSDEESFPTYTAAPSETPTETPTETPSPTKTRVPTKTPTETIVPINATETAVALSLQATSEHKQRKSDILVGCQPIDWVELSEVEYARDHEGECVYIKGQISDLNLEDDLFSMYIGYYSARIAVGFDDLKRTDLRLKEDMWVNVYGTVSTTTWISMNNFTGQETATVGLQGRLLELPGNVVWMEYVR